MILFLFNLLMSFQDNYEFYSGSHYIDLMILYYVNSDIMSSPIFSPLNKLVMLYQALIRCLSTLNVRREKNSVFSL